MVIKMLNSSLFKNVSKKHTKLGTEYRWNVDVLFLYCLRLWLVSGFWCSMAVADHVNKIILDCPLTQCPTAGFSLYTAFPFLLKSAFSHRFESIRKQELYSIEEEKQSLNINNCKLLRSHSST